ncbi:MAG: hypothetical protein ABID04_02960 [Patescibacteria group bacterium]
MKTKNRIVFIFILVAVFLFYLKPPLDTDLGWHLRYGQQIAQNQAVFKDNQIGFFLSDYQWVHSNSLHQLLCFLAYQYFGLGSLAIIGSAILTLTVFLLIKNRPWWWQLLATGIFILTALPVTGLGYRSQLYTLLGVALVYAILEQWLKQKNWSLLLPPLFLLWANLHGGFVLGLGLVGLIACFQLINKQTKRGLGLLAILLVCFFSTLVNPFGWKIYPEAYRHSWYPLNQLIAEWLPPNPLGVFTILALIGLVVFLFLAQNSKKLLANKNKLFYLTSWGVFILWAFKARRNLPIFGISSIFLVWQLLPQKIAKYQIKNSFYLACFGLLSVVALSQLKNLNSLHQDWTTICQNSQWTLPCQAVDFLKPQTQICQKIFNTYEWGGYLVWHLPDRKVFVDGRMPAWPTQSGKSPYTIYLEILQTQPGFEASLDQFGADCLFIGTGTFLDLELKQNPNPKWREIFSDQVATIYQKQN